MNKIGFSDIAKQFVGAMENSTIHHNIVDAYNMIKPLPRGYKVSYNDPWCAVFVSAVLSCFKCVKPPYECSANIMWTKCKINKQVVKTPKKDDLIFYSWKCNGTANHVGIISKVEKNVIYTIEGNKSNRVDTRRILKSNIYILGYARIENKGGAAE